MHEMGLYAIYEQQRPRLVCRSLQSNLDILFFDIYMYVLQYPLIL